jgi:putative tricarboxylic transport membrane protein
MSSDRIFGLILIALAAGMSLLAWQFHAPISYEPIGPRAYPLLVAVLIAICSLWLVFRPGKGAPWPQGAIGRKVTVMLLVLFAYAALFLSLGFVLATALVTIGVGRLFGGTWKQTVIGGTLLGIGLYVFFDILLDVALPVGDLWNALQSG